MWPPQPLVEPSAEGAVKVNPDDSVTPITTKPGANPSKPANTYQRKTLTMRSL